MTQEQRMGLANRRMEDSSAQCVRLINQTLDTAAETSEELELQRESLNRTEAHLDAMDVDLEQSKRSMREVKSVWGGWLNRFTKPTFAAEPKIKSKPMPKQPSDSGRRSNKGSQRDEKPKNESTGNATVDKNLDEIERGLQMLNGHALLMGHQLDESNQTIDRIKVKMERNDVKIKSITKDVKREAA